MNYTELVQAHDIKDSRLNALMNYCQGLPGYRGVRFATNGTKGAGKIEYKDSGAIVTMNLSKVSSNINSVLAHEIMHYCLVLKGAKLMLLPDDVDLDVYDVTQLATDLCHHVLLYKRLEEIGYARCNKRPQNLSVPMPYSYDRSDSAYFLDRLNLGVGYLSLNQYKDQDLEDMFANAGQLELYQAFCSSAPRVQSEDDVNTLMTIVMKFFKECTGIKLGNHEEYLDHRRSLETW